MELLSQLDITSPDHVSVITRQNRVIISVRKDGSDITVGFPITGNTFNTSTDQLPIQSEPIKPTTEYIQPKPAQMLSESTQYLSGPRVDRVNGMSKLNVDQVREIKLLLSDSNVCNKFGSRSKFHKALASKYNVSDWAIKNIDIGQNWKHVTIDTTTQETNDQDDEQTNEPVKQSVVRIDRTEDGRQIEIRHAEPKVTKLPRHEPNSRRPQTAFDNTPFQAKLTENQVIEIKKILKDKSIMSSYDSNWKAYKDIGKAYGVSHMAIQFIDRGVTWKHVHI